MLTRLCWLALEVASLDRADEFYGDLLELPVMERSVEERRYPVGDSELRLRTPTATQPGGAHVHYAFGTAYGAYDKWLDRLAARFDVEEHSFGTYTSVYVDDPDGHCVEIGQRDVDGHGLEEIFEIVLEVEDLERAERWYRALGFEVSGRGDERPRVRLDSDVLELELWEPHRGLAGARGGEHVDLGFEVRNADELVSRLEDGARRVEPTDEGYRIVDPDGHYLTLLEEK